MTLHVVIWLQMCWKGQKRERQSSQTQELFSSYVSSYRDDGNSPRTINVSVQMRSDCQW